MQNQIIKYELLDNSIDNFVLINPTKQQIYSIPKEESQLIQSQNNNFLSIPIGYNNDPFTQTEKRDQNISSIPVISTGFSDRHYDANFMPTSYIGLSNYEVTTYIDENFAVGTLLNNGVLSPFYTTSGNFSNIMSGLQMLKIPLNSFATILTDPVAIAANGGSNLLYNYKTYNLIISPKYIQSTIIQISQKAHYSYDNLADNETIGIDILPTYLRRTLYHCQNTDFIGTNWAFESSPIQKGRLLGSVVEIWNSTGTILKQTKVMNENAFNFSTPGFTGTIGLTDFALSPDNFGYDPINQNIINGDIIRIFPRETYFNQLIIEIDFVNKAKTVKAALQFITNDAARDMNSATYEIYDDNGVMIDPITGILDGTVVQRYQITQYGNFEVRKKLNN